MRAPSISGTVAEAERPRARGRLFRKYVGLFLAVVCVALLTNGLSEIWFSYQEHKASLIRIQREQAEAAAAKISQFIRCMTHPIGQRCTDDQPTIKGRTSANFGYSKPLFAYVHRTFGDQFILRRL